MFRKEMKFKDISIGEKFYFDSDAEWWALGNRKGRCTKVSTRKYTDSTGSEILIGSITVKVTKASQWKGRK